MIQKILEKCFLVVFDCEFGKENVIFTYLITSINVETYNLLENELGTFALEFWVWMIYSCFHAVGNFNIYESRISLTSAHHAYCNAHLLILRITGIRSTTTTNRPSHWMGSCDSSYQATTAGFRNLFTFYFKSIARAVTLTNLKILNSYPVKSYLVWF